MDAGVDPAAIDAIQRGEAPDLADEAASAVYGLASELLRTQSVSDEADAAAIDALGVQGVVDLVGILGNCTLISMTINAFRIPVPPRAAELFAPLNRPAVAWAAQGA